MDIINFLIIIGSFHCILFFFNTIFRTCSHYPYIYFLENTGLEIKLFCIKWYTTAFNRTIVRWTIDKSKFWTMWFNIGVIISIILLPIASFMIIRMTIMILSSTQSKEQIGNEWTLEPMIPGVNVPFSDIKYHIITIGLSTIIHELGHALAASREDVQLYGVGFLFYIVPAAYVSISLEQLKSLPLQNQLRILCAGVWHNIVLSIIAGLIFFSSSWLWLPLFHTNSGVYVKSINQNSPLLGPTGLSFHDIIYQVNDCDVKNNGDWYRCMLQAIKQPTPGYCVTQTLIAKYDESIPSWTMVNGAVNCCSSDSISEGSLCFDYIESGTQSDPLQLPLHSCLAAREIIEQSNGLCQTSSHCSVPGTHCIKPSFDNATKIVRLMRKDKEDVLFVGHPSEIYRTIEITDWIPKYTFIGTSLPESLELLCKYIVILSSGLGVINIVPCFSFDGQRILNLLIHSLFSRTIKSKSTRHAIALTITSIGSLLVAVNLLYTVMNT
ncbi:hypothetical protein PV327_001483 [Microctonus hyperodae]|uniref:Membrane-bound transcription factor site-2 protease n=1 Tax=Microctonus hyperodae TaxID=165561 RepID=A0AA39G8T9_MICHY|nr:hypothetical protein PV327_001483 [Microctonus hyperodae]